MLSASRRIIAGNSIFIAVLVGVLTIFSQITVSAQSGGGVDQTGTGGRHSIQGRIYFPSGMRSDVRIKVRLESFHSGDLTVLSDANGSFVFRGLEAGSYTVVVDAGGEYQVAREPVYIETDGVTPRRGVTLTPVSRLYTVQITLALKSEVTTKAAVISAALAAVPEKSQAHYRKALGYIHDGDTNKGIEELKLALNLYPDFPLALNELGVQYLKLGQADKAAEELKKAVALSTREFQPILNYGIALLNLRKFSEAEEQLRACIKLNGRVPTAHMYLGIALAVQRKLDEGQAELESAIKSNSPEIALSYRYMGGVFLERRDYARAADMLETYLKLVPKAPDHDLLSRKIQELRKKN